MICVIKYLFDTNRGKLRSAEDTCADDQFQKEVQEVLLLNSEEFESLNGTYKFKINLQKSMEAIQYCKIEMFSSVIQGTMKIPKQVDEDEAISFGFYIDENRLLIIDDEENIGTLLNKMKEYTYGTSSLTQFVRVFFETLLDNDVFYLQQLENRFSDWEGELLDSVAENFNETMIDYRKKILSLHSYYEQLIDIGEFMQENFMQVLSSDECTSWQFYTNRVSRLHDHVEKLREYLLQIRDLYHSQIAIKQNKVMSFLTIVTTIFLPLTLVAGWYGMNFTGMPELGWKYGYPVIIILSIVIIIAEIIYFKKKKML